MQGTEKLKKWGGKTADVEKITRQRERKALRAGAFAEITTQFPGELHSLRRSMARERAQHDYRTLKGLPEPRPEVLA